MEAGRAGHDLFIPVPGPAEAIKISNSSSKPDRSLAIVLRIFLALTRKGFGETGSAYQAGGPVGETQQHTASGDS